MMQFRYDWFMDIQQLKYFLDVAQTEHMTRSAKRLNIAQPALSRSVSRLEHELGVSLFDREGRGLQLTDEGRLFQRKLIPLLNELDSICQEIKGVHAENREVRVHLGAASHIAADAVASWMSAAPNRRISLSQTASRDTEPDVVVDLLFPSVCAKVEKFSERMMLAAPENLMFSRVPVPLDELKGLDFVSLSSSSGFTQFTKELCVSMGFAPRISFESDNPSVVRKMIGLGLGVGFWPERSWGESKGEGVALLPLDIQQKREVYVWLSSSAEDNPLSCSFYDYLCHYFRRCFS